MADNKIGRTWINSEFALNSDDSSWWWKGTRSDGEEFCMKTPINIDILHMTRDEYIETLGVESLLDDKCLCAGEVNNGCPLHKMAFLQ